MPKSKVRKKAKDKAVREQQANPKSGAACPDPCCPPASKP